MSWTVPPPKFAKKPAPPADGATLSTQRLPHGHTALVLALGTSMAARLGVEAGSVVEVAHGEGPHTGLIRLTRAPAGAKGWKVAANKHGVLRLFVSALPPRWASKPYADARLTVELHTEIKPAQAVLTLPPGAVAREGKADE